MHRDLKPSNVLVTNEGVPKLLDFGIAKLLDAAADDEDGHTVTQWGVMTPEYASPEQIRGDQVTTATDVYSLGILLYELLTGQRPYRVTGRRRDELAGVMGEVEPVRPSLAISNFESSSADAKSGSSSRRSAFANSKLLRGDLDNIALMALRKEPSRRYSSVSHLADDVRRHLDGLPVVARSDTFGYRTSKYLRRHRVGVAVATLFVLTLVGGVFALAWQARVAAAEARRARLEADKSRQINRFLQEVFGSPDPGKRGRDVRVAEVLDEAARRTDQDLSGQPEVMAEVRRTIGATYSGLGLFDSAEPHLRAALETHRVLYGNVHWETARSMGALASLLASKGDYAGAEALFREALAVQRGSREARDDLPETLFWLAITLFNKGDTEGSDSTSQEALAAARAPRSQ